MHPLSWLQGLSTVVIQAILNFLLLYKGLGLQLSLEKKGCGTFKNILKSLRPLGCALCAVSQPWEVFI